MNGFLTTHSALELFGSRYHENAFCESTPVALEESEALAWIWD